MNEPERSTKREIRLSWAGATDVGLVRSQNQDSMYADMALFVVADGLGGATGGEVASNLAVRAMVSRKPSTKDDLVEAVVHANEIVHTRSIEQTELQGMGTTLCAIAVIKTEVGHQIGLVNVGDSRAYRQQNGTLEQLTFDHNRVAELLRYGIISEAEAAVHEQRHTLTRAIGVGPTVSVDNWLFNMNAGDRYLLCSDGITNELPKDEISTILSSHPSVTGAAGALVQAANDYGGNDNSTALVVDISFEKFPDTDSTSNSVSSDTTEQIPDEPEKRRRWFQSREP